MMELMQDRDAEPEQKMLLLLLQLCGSCGPKLKLGAQRELRRTTDSLEVDGQADFYLSRGLSSRVRSDGDGSTEQ